MLDGLLFLLVGMCLVAFGSITLGRPESLNLFLMSSVSSKTQVFLTGVGVEIIGLMLLLNFGVFADGLLLIMSLIGWLATAKGFLMIVVPDRFARMVHDAAGSGPVLLLSPMIGLSLGFFMIVASCFL